MSPEAFIAAARAYMGVRWHHMGRTREGLDCIGLLLLAARDCGLPHPMPDPYAKGVTGFDLFGSCEKIGRQIPLAQMQDGDIMVFACGAYPGHLGIYTTPDNVPHVLHAPINRRKVTEERFVHELVKQLRRVYRPAAFEVSE